MKKEKLKKNTSPNCLIKVIFNTQRKKKLFLKEEKKLKLFKLSIKNEIAIMRKLSHPNLIKLLEVHESANSIYLILEYFNGGTLRDLLMSNIKLNKHQISLIIKGIAEGLAYIHNLKIIHRDIKLDNILFAAGNLSEPKIVGLGLATFEDEGKYLYPRCGTPGYVAPEIINVKSLDAKYTCVSDIFGLGIIFHKL